MMVGYSAAERKYSMPARKIKVIKRDNNFQHIEVLKRNREKRSRYGEFLVEGVKSINRLVEYGWEINSFIYASDKPLSNWARDILNKSKAKTHFELSGELMADLSDKEDPSELLAVAAMPEDSLSRIRLHERLLLVIFDRPSNPGNLGTIIRTCDSLRADGLIITGHCVDLYDPQTIRASVGSLFAVPVIRVPSQNELLPWLGDIRSQYADFRISGTDERAEVDIDAHDFTGPLAFVLGNETDGMSRAYRELCDEMIRIPIYGSATSLNVACAGAIVLYEIDRQRRTAEQTAAQG